MSSPGRVSRVRPTLRVVLIIEYLVWIIAMDSDFFGLEFKKILIP